MPVLVALGGYVVVGEALPTLALVGIALIVTGIGTFAIGVRTGVAPVL